MRHRWNIWKEFPWWIKVPTIVLAPIAGVLAVWMAFVFCVYFGCVGVYFLAKGERL